MTDEKYAVFKWLLENATEISMGCSEIQRYGFTYHDMPVLPENVSYKTFMDELSDLASNFYKENK